MEQSRVVTGVLAVLCVLAVSLTGVTLPATVQTNPGTGDGAGLAGPGDGEGIGVAQSGARSGGPAADIPGVEWILSLLAVLALVLVVLYVFVYWRRAFPVLFGVLGFVGLAWLFAQLLSGRGRDSGFGGGAVAGTLSTVNGGGGGTGYAVPTVLATAIAGLTLLALVAVAVVVLRDEIASGTTDAPSEPTQEDLAAVGAAAGRAARSIEREASLDNAIYRAWNDMTRLLDVREPASSTPREFERAAMDAGMDHRDVSELTTLFRRVRYGGEPPDEQAEQQAIDLLETIESRYGSDQS
jgi:hypothetical protein